VTSMVSWSRRRAIAGFAIASMLVVPAPGIAGVVDGFKSSGDLAVYLGVVPAATVRGHPAGHPESQMHGGAPSSAHSMHIVAAVFEKDSGERITKAKVTAHITEPGGLQRSMRLEPMKIAGTVTYGGFTTFARGIDYQIGIRVERSPHMETSRSPQTPPRMHRVKPVTVHFDYTHD
jgi:hypothetical protein